MGAGDGLIIEAHIAGRRASGLKTILIVEDDVSIGDLLAEALEREGYRAARAWSGTEALLLLERTRPDLVLLDLTLPGLSGEALLPRLSGIPVIVVSARTDTDSKVNMLFSGAADYVTKPFEIRELLARISLRLREAPACPALLERGGGRCGPPAPAGRAAPPADRWP